MFPMTPRMDGLNSELRGYMRFRCSLLIGIISRMIPLVKNRATWKYRLISISLNPQIQYWVRYQTPMDSGGRYELG